MINKPLKTASWSALILFALTMFIYPSVSFSLGELNSLVRFSVQTLSFIVTSSFLFLIFNGFIFLGKEQKNKTLVVASWIMFFALILSSFLILQTSNQFYEIVIDSPIMQENFENLPEAEQEAVITQVIESKGNEILSLILKISLVIFLIFASTIVFGISLIELKEVSLSKITGILFIIGGITSLIFIGIFILMMASILVIILLFKVSNNLEMENQKKIKPKRKARKNVKKSR